MQCRGRQGPTRPRGHICSCLPPLLATTALQEKTLWLPFHPQKSHASCSLGQFQLGTSKGKGFWEMFPADQTDSTHWAC